MYGIGEFLPKATAECKLKVLGHQEKNHANKSKKPMKEIIDMLTFGEWFVNLLVIVDCLVYVLCRICSLKSEAG